MTKTDLKKELKNLYSASAKEVVFVDVPKMNFLIVDGAGDPNTASEFQEAVEALYGVSYTLKFMIKRGKEAIDYSVMPLEGLWWADDITVFSTGNKDMWKWTLMIMQPECVTMDLVAKALEELKKKKNLPIIANIRFKSLHEGLSAQIMHIGPYSAEGPTIEKLHSFIKENGYILTGKHHEIYLGDPRRCAPEKLKTILRHPITPL